MADGFITTTKSMSEMEGPLVRAAIDAYMAENGYEKRGDEYMSHHAFPKLGNAFRVSRPGEDGYGGGQVLQISGFAGDIDPDANAELPEPGEGDGAYGHPSEEQWARANAAEASQTIIEAFTDIRSRIAIALDRWRIMPEPASLATAVADAKEAAMYGTSAGAAGGHGEFLAGDLDGVLNNLTAPFTNQTLVGNAFTAFVTNIIGPMRSVGAGMTDLGLSRTEACAAVAATWSAAHQDLESLIEQTTESLDAITPDDGGGVNWKLLLAVGSGIAAIIAAVPSGGTSVAAWTAAQTAAVAGAGLGTISGVIGSIDTSEKDGGGDTMNSCLNKLEFALIDLNRAVEGAEIVIVNTIRANIALAQGGGSSAQFFRMGAWTPLDTGDNVPEIIHDDAVALSVHNSLLPAVSSMVANKRALVHADFGMPTISNRAGDLGLGGGEVMFAVADLTDLYIDLLKEYEETILAAAENFKMAANELSANEQAAEQMMKNMQAEFSESEADKPDYSTTTVAPDVARHIQDLMENVFPGMRRGSSDE